MIIFFLSKQLCVFFTPIDSSCNDASRNASFPANTGRKLPPDEHRSGMGRGAMRPFLRFRKHLDRKRDNRLSRHCRREPTVENPRSAPRTPPGGPEPLRYFYRRSVGVIIEYAGAGY